MAGKENRDDRQIRFLELYLDPKSDTYTNAYQSAKKAGFSEEYSQNITGQMPKWLLEAKKTYKYKVNKNNKTCFLCNENRALQKAHLVPRRLVGNNFNNKNNIILLCATHHWCYDHFCLNKKEMDKIVANFGFNILNIIKETYLKEVKNNSRFWIKWGKWFYPFKNKFLQSYVTR